MSKFNWRNGFAVGLIVGIGLTILFVDLTQLSHEPIKHDGNYASRSSGNEVHGEQKQAQEKYPLRYWAQRLVSLEDTAAQWLMTAFSIVAAVLLWRTLRATQKMARDARDIGDEQTRAASFANDVAAESIQAQRRPFIMVSPSMPSAHDWPYDNDSAEWNIDIENHGSGPAFIRKADVYCWVSGSDNRPNYAAQFPMIDEGFAGQTKQGVLVPNKPVSRTALGPRLMADPERIGFSRAERSHAFFNGHIFAWIEIDVEYESLYGTIHTTAALFRLKHHAYTIEQVGGPQRNYRT